MPDYLFIYLFIIRILISVIKLNYLIGSINWFQSQSIFRRYDLCDAFNPCNFSQARTSELYSTDNNNVAVRIDSAHTLIRLDRLINP